MTRSNAQPEIDAEAVAAAAAAAGVPAAPRAVSPAIGRRAWGEPGARGLLLLGIAFVLAGLWFAWTERLWRVERALYQRPTTDALITQAGIETIPGRPVASGAGVEVQFEVAGRKVRAWGTLAEYAKASTTLIGNTIPIRVDPNEPTRWTARSVPPSLAQELTAGGIAAAIGVATLAAAWLARRRVLRAWRVGEPAVAEVVALLNSPLAPRSRVAKCARVDGGDRRVFPVYVRGRSSYAVGDQLIVLIPPGGGRAMHATWMGEEKSGGVVE